jgi:glutamate dehydrogenase (NADP+)
MDERLGAIYDDVVRRNPGEIDFQHGVLDVLACLSPALAKHPDMAEHKIVERCVRAR